MGCSFILISLLSKQILWKYSISCAQWVIVIVNQKENWLYRHILLTPVKPQEILFVLLSITIPRIELLNIETVTHTFIILRACKVNSNTSWKSKKTESNMKHAWPAINTYININNCYLKKVLLHIQGGASHTEHLVYYL